MHRAAITCLALVACGAPEPTVHAGPAASTIATQASSDDVIVAQVNGRPVWGSCVAAQGKGRTARAGLDDCIAFELLAQAAEARGLANDPEVAEATRTALVDRLVETGFEARYRSAADLADTLDAIIERNKSRLERPALRSSAYARVEIAPTAPPELDAKAHAVAEKIAAAVAGETGLQAVQFEELVKPIAAAEGTPIKTEVVRLMPQVSLIKSYADALWSIPEIGRTAPHAIRTKFGWDVILLTDMTEPRTYTRAEAAADAFPEARRRYFTTWVNEIIHSRGVHIEVDPKTVAKLDEVGP